MIICFLSGFFLPKLKLNIKKEGYEFPPMFIQFYKF
jgi:hypothetical protein